MATIIQHGNILLACEEQTRRESSQFIEDHVFGYIVSGSLLIEAEGQRAVHGEGTCGVMRRNQLGRFMKQTPQGGIFRSVSIFLDQELLRSFSLEYGITSTGVYNGAAVRGVTSNELTENFFRSFIPYFDPTRQMGEDLVKLKVREGILLLLHIYPDLKDMLFDFRQPGKIDLESFMRDNYRHNVSMSRMAQLTGRSLTTFKTDFEKIFGTSPGRWLQQRRLSEAMVLIKEKGRRASDIYLDLGFEDLSHFSFAFKKQFGVPPSMI